MTTDDILKQGIAALNAGQKAEARRLLMQVVQQDERNEIGWLWLSGAVDTGKERRVCLENVLAINPNNGMAKRGLASLTAKAGVRPLSVASSPTQHAEPAATFHEQSAQPPTIVSAPTLEPSRDVKQREEQEIRDKVYELQIEINKLEAAKPSVVNLPAIAVGLLGIGSLILSFIVIWNNVILGGSLFLLGLLCWSVLRSFDRRDEAKRRLLEQTIDLQKKRMDELEARLSVIPSPMPRIESATIPREQPIQPPTETSAPEVTRHKRRKPSPRRKKATRKQTGLMIGVGAGVLAIACVVLAGIWWVIDGGLLQSGPAALVADTIPAQTSISPDNTWTRPADEMLMVYVPAGEFEMGSDGADVDYALQLCNEYLFFECGRESFQNEQPAHIVALDDFWIDRTEVTNAQYRQCVEAGACQAPMTCYMGEPSTYGDASKAEHPVVCVNWYGAQAYCEWAGGRLPTEAEWEYAARGPEGHMFPWGDEFDETRLNYCDANCEAPWPDEAVDDGYAETAPVGSYPGGASWCGVLDMAGNVWEWAADWYAEDYYGRSPSRNPIGPSSGEFRALRGGSWIGTPDNVRSASRGWIFLDDGYKVGGFRCARDSE